MSSPLLLPLAAFIVSALCGWGVIPLITRYCRSRGLYDQPDERKVHKHAIPRLGGVCFLPSMLLSALISIFVVEGAVQQRVVTMSLWSLIFFVSLLIIYATGIMDDLIGLPPAAKFVAQIIAAALLPLSNLWINDAYGLFGFSDIPSYIGYALTVFVVVLINNAINLIDGIDGLAGGLSLLALGGFLYAFAREGMTGYCILIAGLMGVLVAYLYFNLYGSPEQGTKLFMGDSGSLTLGFILAFLFVKFASNSNQAMPYRRDGLVLSFTLLIVPVFDVFRVVLYRLRHRHPLFKADKHHIHHKLLACGLSQHQALATILLLALALVAINIALAYGIELTVTPIVLIDIALYVAFHLALDLRLRRKHNSYLLPPTS